MNNEVGSVDQSRKERTLDLIPELDRRYAVLRAVLERLLADEAVADSELWLAHGDLNSVINVMVGKNVDNEESSND